MKRIIILCIIVLFTTCSNNINDADKTIESADAAYDQFKLKKSGEILNAMLLIDSLHDKQKCQVLRRLAHQNWKYYKNYELAKKQLLKADSIRKDQFDTWISLSQIEREYGNFENSIEASTIAESIAKSTSDINSAKIESAQIAYDIIINNMENDILLNHTLLNETSELLLDILKTNAGMPKPSKLLLGISLLNNDGKNVLKAWQSYFHIQDIQKTYPYLKEAANKLNKVCKNWCGGKLNRHQQEELIAALALSRLYDLIFIYAKANKNKKDYNQNINDIISYSLYLKDIKSKTNEYYRQIAIEKENEKDYKNWLEKRKKQLWNTLSFLSQKEYNKRDFDKETEKHFGARGFEGSTASYKGFNLCLGHIVNQKTAIVEQYGYKPEFIYTEIDMMISNTFPSWYWKDKASGGWATNNEIIQVREAYLNRPFLEWNSITDSTDRKSIEQLNTEFINMSRDPNILKQTKGLERKLNFDASIDLYNKLYNKGYRNNNLKLAFLSTFKHYRMEATILAHEGRHSIEKRFMPEQFEKWNNEEREFHAKLSQIIFATEPRYELAGMLTNISESGHGKANKRIADIAIEWIKANKEEINGYSEEKSEFSQIYLLSVKQIKDCYKKSDPMNK
ncbi:MAG: hypothetical protein ACEPOV_06290 [Hyphomicrobiales bacterium]